MLGRKIYITGIAGFIGFHLAIALKKRGDIVFGCDNFNSYYSPELKKKRSALLEEHNIPVENLDICKIGQLHSFLKEEGITDFVHLAAQAGVRYSLEAPQTYIESNIRGFVEVLELVKKLECPLTFASSSSVYGENQKLPFSETDRTDLPASLYGATKKSGELLATSYYHLYGVKSTALRYFTVYGPWGRPDMAYFSFAKSIIEEKPIHLFNKGQMQRDFTYIDDIVQGTIAAIDRKREHDCFNLACGQTRPLLDLVSLLEKSLEKKAILTLDPMQKGDVKATFGDISSAREQLGYHPTVSLEEGVARFIEWFLPALC